jgi:hypothetical protein
MTNSNGEPVKIDMNSKILLGAWHPKDNTFAVSKNNSLFIYSEKKSSGTYNNHSMSNNMMDN